MNIEYKILLKVEEKEEIRDEFQNFFFSIYQQILSDIDWKHQFIHSPYNDSPLFLVLDDGKIIGSALMISQKFTDGTIDGLYYLWTTSAIAKAYRSKGVYAELLSKQRDYAEKTNKSFIFAFPNKLAYPVVKLFGGFKDLQTSNLVRTTIKNIDLSKVSNSLILDKDFFNWRFEHKDYLFFMFKEHILIAKNFEGTFDILAIYDKNVFNGIEMEYREISENQTIITLELFLFTNSKIEILDIVKGTYFPINRTINYNNITINLLMSDVF